MIVGKGDTYSSMMQPLAYVAYAPVKQKQKQKQKQKPKKQKTNVIDAPASNHSKITESPTVKTLVGKKEGGQEVSRSGKGIGDMCRDEYDQSTSICV